MPTTIAIDLNDSSIVLADASGILAVEPGYAYANGQVVVTGAEASAQARLYPRKCSNCFWDRLSLEPGSAGIDGIGSAAELAYVQLNRLWDEQGKKHGHDALLLVPGHYGRDQLGVLLGLAQECEIPVRAMLNRGVAAAAAPYAGCQLIYVDAALHRVSVTLLEQSPDQVTAQAERSLEAMGLATITDLLAKRVAELFVLKTRFDPLHSAASEQALYNRLRGWLDTLEAHSERLELTLPHDGGEIAIEVELDQLMSVMSGFCRAVVQLISQSRDPGENLVVLLSDRLARLPGMIAALEQLDDAEVVELQPGHAARGAAAHAESLADGTGNVRLLKRLPWREAGPQAVRAAAPSQPVASSRSSVAPSAPSHIVYRGVAYRVDTQGLLIGREHTPDKRTIVLNGGQTGVSRAHCEVVRRDGELRLTDMSSFGTFVNEKRVSGEVALRPADIIRIGSPGEQLQVIRMEDAHGA